MECIELNRRGKITYGEAHLSFEKSKDKTLGQKKIKKSNDKTSLIKRRKMSAESHKIQGNIYYSQQLYHEAIKEYSIAIIKDPTHVSFYTNRANCYIKLENYSFAAQDSRKAIEVDPTWLKAYYFLSQSLIALQEFSQAIPVLKKAISISTSNASSSHYTKELTMLFRMAKRQQWQFMNTSRLEKESELFNYIKDLMRLSENLYIKDSMQDGSIITDQTQINTETQKKNQEYLNQLSNLLFELQELRNPCIPDAFLDKISLQVMLDPYISPSGITYDKFEITSHLNQIGSFDPLTREPLTEKELIPNLALKELIEEFTNKFGKAFDD